MKLSPPGLYQKFVVRRTDGRSAEGEKHERCEYLVLDWDHDPFAIAAGRAYADACEVHHPELARDIRAQADQAEAFLLGRLTALGRPSSSACECKTWPCPCPCHLPRKDEP
jgi:hypothetical protein